MSSTLYLSIIVVYLAALIVFNFVKARKVKSQDDFMVAGRSLSVYKMVFTLICTWIGSGTFIAGAEYAFKAGWSALWMPAGAWVGIAIIYFLAAKIRTFGQYTIGDILEARYGRFARLFGALCLVVAFTTIVAYQFRAGGYILNVITDGRVTVHHGQIMAAAFVILFTALGGMVAVAHTDLPNGIIIVLACVLATPFTIAAAGGWDAAAASLPASHFAVFPSDFGERPALKAGGYCLATMLLLLGVQSMYQKFYSARTPRDARVAVALWIVGTIVVETVVVVIAIYGAARYWGTGVDPASVVLVAARNMVPAPVGVLLLAAACAVVISTGMNYLFSPSTNIVHDIYQRFFSPPPEGDAEASARYQRRVVAIQKVFIVVVGLVAFLMVFVPTYLGKPLSVLQMSYFAYTMYGVAITPALVAALAWKRATRAGGLASIVGGGLAALFFEKILPAAWPEVVRGDDPFGVPSIYPAFAISVLALVVVSLFGPRPSESDLARLFPPRETRPSP